MVPRLQYVPITMNLCKSSSTAKCGLLEISSNHREFVYNRQKTLEEGGNPANSRIAPMKGYVLRSQIIAHSFHIVLSTK